MSEYKFRPVRGTAAEVLSAPYSEGALFFTTDTLQIFCDLDGERQLYSTSSSGEGGATVTVDSELSAISENPLQNKVITKKIDEIEKTIRENADIVDDVLSETSENPVQNKVITKKFKEFENFMVGNGSGMNQTVLWEGYRDTAGIIELSGDITQYDMIAIGVGNNYYEDGLMHECEYRFIPKSDFSNYTQDQQFVIVRGETEENLNRLAFRFTTETSLEILSAQYLPYIQFGIFKIIGINYNSVALQYYTNEEQVVGLWTNGKPIYKKTFNCEEIAGGTQQLMGTLEEAEDIISGAGTFSSSNGTIFPLIYSEGSVQYARWYFLSSDLGVYVSHEMSNSNIYNVSLTVEYTKTVDKEGTIIIPETLGYEIALEEEIRALFGNGNNYAEGLKLIDLSGLKTFKEEMGVPEFSSADEGKILIVEKGKIAPSSNNFGVTVDSELSDISKNPVENRVITEKIAELEESIAQGGSGGGTADLETLDKRYASKEKYGDSIVSVGRKADTEVGENSFAFGKDVEASGAFSFGIGTDNVVSGQTSYAEGNNNTASGDYSHAEGNNTEASNYEAHAEGWGTIASGIASHAEGEDTTASGEDAHAEGYKTIASGTASHAEGTNTKAEGTYAHAEGGATKALGQYSHAEGCETEASASVLGAHAEGYKTVASGDFTHAEGMSTTASGSQAHAEGAHTAAAGNYSHAEGFESIAAGFYTHAEGYSTKALKTGSHAEGYETTVNNENGHAEGKGTSVSGYSGHAEGVNSVASGEASHAEGQSTQAVALYTHAEGLGNVAASAYQHVQGKYNLPDGNDTYAHMIGNGTDNTNRSNAHTVDWDGNAWYAGNVYVGGASQTEGKALATVEYVDSVATGGSGGGSITVDSELSLESENPVQNKVITTEINNIQNQIDVLNKIEGSLDVYSEEERVIGVWTDGKPLYQKTIITTPEWSNGLCNIDVSNMNIDYGVIENGIVLVGNEGRWLPHNYWQTSSYNICTRYDNLDKIIQIKALGWSLTDVKITLQYTKTTDSSNDIVVPQNEIIKPIHYSTEEQCIGTWINGSSIYQITLTWEGSTSTESWTDIPYSANISEIINIDVVASFDGVYYVNTNPTLILSAGYNNNTQMAAINWATTHSSVKAYITLQYTKTTE